MTISGSSYIIDKTLRVNYVEYFDKQKWRTNITKLIKYENQSLVLRIQNLKVIVCYVNTECGRKNSRIWEANKNQTKQDNFLFKS
jgi:hypothetical protein